jgi:hypothetical protein
MTHLTANTRPLDNERAARLLLAWMDGDKLALDVVLDEAATDPIGTPGLLFALTDFGVAAADAATPDAGNALRNYLLQAAGRAQEDE